MLVDQTEVNITWLRLVHGNSLKEISKKQEAAYNYLKKEYRIQGRGKFKIQLSIVHLQGTLARLSNFNLITNKYIRAEINSLPTSLLINKQSTRTKTEINSHMFQDHLV